MSFASKPPRKTKNLGTPPSADEAPGNLQQPELAPAPAPPSSAEQGKPAKPPARKKIDGRRLRHTGRTEQFATRVTPEWKAQLHALADRTGRLYVDLLEEALADLDKKLSSR